jgi:hypothetical protein
VTGILAAISNHDGQWKIMGRVRMSPGRRIGIAILVLIGRPIAWTYHLLFDGIGRRITAKGNERFACEIKETFDRLLPQFPVSVVPPDRIIPSFDYSGALAEFPDRQFSFARGRYEFTVTLTMENRVMGIPVFSTTMPTSSGRNGRDGGALELSIRFLRRNWDRIPDADISQLRAMAQEMDIREA